MAAIRAPSGHNTQPWSFTWNRQALHVGWEPGRELQEGDRSRRYLWLGLGAAIESLALAAAVRGFDSDVALVVDLKRHEAAELRFHARRVNLNDADLAAALFRRKTTRLPFSRSLPPEVHLGGLHRMAEASDLTLRFTSERDNIRANAAAIRQGTARNLADPAISSEFCRWLRFPNDRRPDGLSTAALEFHGLASLGSRLALRPRVLAAGAPLGLTSLFAGTQQRLAMRTPLFGFLTAATGDTEALIEAGRGMQRIWLLATQQGLRIHPMTAGLDYPETSQQIARAFGASADEQPVICFRIGYGPEGIRSERRAVQDVLKIGND
jgi:hypothetical protein